MKKKLLLLILILLTTGCTCEYNLTIDKNEYHEEIIINGTTQNEIINFKQNWKIPVNKDEYNIGFDAETEENVSSNIYDYKISNNQLIFTYNFTNSSISDSSAIYNCYDRLSIVNQDNKTIISTSSRVNCFVNYPTLTNIKINIKGSNSVFSHNADSVSGNIYTWNIDKNSTEKPINIIFNNSSDNSIIQDTSTKPNKDNQSSKYGIYIFALIILVIIYFGYKFATNFMNKDKNVED